MKKKSTGQKLDIACGKNKKHGFLGVDIWEGADIVYNLEQFPWPFADSSIEEIFCSHYIEHTPDLISFANELYRIMEVGATAEIIAPYYSSIRAWQDPTHLRAISENTFFYFNRGWRMANKLDHYPLVSDFDFSYRLILDQAWQGKTDEELQFATRHYINVVSDIHVILTKRPPVDDRVELSLSSASTCWINGNFDEALVYCKELVGTGNANCDIYLMIAENALRTGDLESAAEAFQNALSTDRDSPQAHAGLIRALKRSGKNNKAAAHIRGIRKKNKELADSIEAILELS